MPAPPALRSGPDVFDREGMPTEVLLNVWRNAHTDRDWRWGLDEPEAVFKARLQMEWESTYAEPEPPAYPTWRQEAAALLGLALGALLVVAVVAAGLAAAAGRVREAWGGGL